MDISTELSAEGVHACSKMSRIKTRPKVYPPDVPALACRPNGQRKMLKKRMKIDIAVKLHCLNEKLNRWFSKSPLYQSALCLQLSKSMYIMCTERETERALFSIVGKQCFCLREKFSQFPENGWIFTLIFVMNFPNGPTNLLIFLFLQMDFANFPNDLS